MKIGNYSIDRKDFGWAVFVLILALCFSISGYFYGRRLATEILSIVATSISIVLSIVAILYTLISGTNSSAINTDTKKTLESIETKLKNLDEKVNQKQELSLEMQKKLSAIERVLENTPTEYKQAVDDMVDGLSRWIDD